MEIHEFLSTATAGEIMFTDVVTLSPADLVHQAAEMLVQEQVSGAPVVDKSGVCVGVFSVSDVILAERKATKEAQQVAASGFFTTSLALPASVFAEKLDQLRDKIAPASKQPIERFMTKDLVSVSTDSPLSSIIQKMLDAHVHRVLVLDANKRLKGLISTIDVLAAFQRAAQRTLSR